MKISPGVEGHEKYGIFYACALHLNRDPDKRRLKASKKFRLKTEKCLRDFLSKYDYKIDEIERFFNL